MFRPQAAQHSATGCSIRSTTMSTVIWAMCWSASGERISGGSGNFHSAISTLPRRADRSPAPRMQIERVAVQPQRTARHDGGDVQRSGRRRDEAVDQRQSGHQLRQRQVGDRHHPLAQRGRQAAFDPIQLRSIGIAAGQHDSADGRQPLDGLKIVLHRPVEGAFAAARMNGKQGPLAADLGDDPLLDLRPLDRIDIQIGPGLLQCERNSQPLGERQHEGRFVIGRLFSRLVAAMGAAQGLKPPAAVGHADRHP